MSDGTVVLVVLCACVISVVVAAAYWYYYSVDPDPGSTDPGDDPYDSGDDPYDSGDDPYDSDPDDSDDEEIDSTKLPKTKLPKTKLPKTTKTAKVPKSTPYPTTLETTKIKKTDKAPKNPTTTAKTAKTDKAPKNPTTTAKTAKTDKAPKNPTTTAKTAKTDKTEPKTPEKGAFDLSTYPVVDDPRHKYHLHVYMSRPEQRIAAGRASKRVCHQDAYSMSCGDGTKRKFTSRGSDGQCPKCSADTGCDGTKACALKCGKLVDCAGEADWKPSPEYKAWLKRFKKAK